MLERIVTVQLLNLKNSFCFLGPKVTEQLGSNVIVKISYGNHEEAYFSPGQPLPNGSDDYIGINSVYAKVLQLKDNDIVHLTEICFPTKVQSFTICPVRFDDYHVLDVLKDEVENCVLRQTRAVNEKQCFIIWIGDNLNIPVKVVSVEPSAPGLLDNLTELIILPQTETSVSRNFVSEGGIPKNDKETSPEKNIDFDIFNIPEKLTESQMEIQRKLKFYSNRKKFIKARLVPFDFFRSSDISKYLYQFSVFILKNEASPSWKRHDSFKEPIFCSLEMTNNSNVSSIVVRVFLISESTLNDSAVLKNNVYVHESLFAILKCETGRQVILKPLERGNINEEIIICTQNNKENVKDLLKEYLAEICQNQEFVLNADIPIKLQNDTLCILKFKSSSLKYCLVNENFLRNCKYIVEEDSSVSNLVIQQMEKHVDFVSTTRHQSIHNSIIQDLKINLTNNRKIFSSLISGDFGSGKTTLLEKIRKSLFEAPFFIYSEVVNCTTLKGKTTDSLHKVFTSIFQILVYHQPSILFIDDIHILCDNVLETDGQAQNAVYYDRTSEMMYTLFSSITSQCMIGIIATTVSVNKLNKNFYSSRGMHLFLSIYHIESLTKDDRSKIIEHFFKDCSSELDIDELSRRTEGYVFQDLFDFIQKAKFQSIKYDSENMIVKDEYCEIALSQMTMLSLSGVKLHSPGDKDFTNIGGLKDIKQILTETLLWPLKYPNLFESAPIRLLSGILLYGAPGTGKTLLAAAAAKQFAIRLISIKGPELLSKYIGASEQAVRDVFKKAQNAKPCVLFFDEFDSLAPRRGHDSTGVTDRVVNQLLTQMDGVESLNGVSVIAATSRPDLLDPALLRPGRLDRLIMCPLPDLETRIDILRIKSKTLDFAEDANLEEIAQNTEGFSGADLQSLLYNAQLASVEHMMLAEDKNDSKPKPITQEMLKTSLSKTEPSLSIKERKKYDLIYSKFQGKSNEPFVQPGSRVSLA